MDFVIGVWYIQRIVKINNIEICEKYGVHNKLQ